MHYEGGSTRKPYIAFELLTIDPNREFNTWNEKCVYGSSVIFNLNPFSPKIFTLLTTLVSIRLQEFFYELHQQLKII